MTTTTTHAVICTPNGPDFFVTEASLDGIVKAVRGGRDVGDAVTDAFPDASDLTLALIASDVADILAGVAS